MGGPPMPQIHALRVRQFAHQRRSGSTIILVTMFMTAFRQFCRPVHFAVLCLALTTAAAAHAAEKVDFEREIQPVLSEHCFRCHGQDDKSRKAQLRLDNRETALRGGKSRSAAIVPGQPQQSEIIVRLTSDDPDKLMPPP